MTTTDPLLTYGQAAELCGVAKSTIRRWVDKGDLDVVRLPSGTPRIATSALTATTTREHQ